MSALVAILNRRTGAALVSLALPFSPLSATDGSADDRLRQEVEELRELVRQQGARIEALETNNQNQRSVDVVVADTSKTRRNGKLSDAQPTGRFPDDAIVTSGDFPGSISIPGRGGSVRIGGFVRADVVHDVDSVGFEDLVLNRTIPLDGDNGDGDSQTRLSARLSRINVDFRRNTERGLFRTFIEADFFGGGDELLSNYEFRLRHAAAQFGDFYAGQWWSSFADVRSLPESGDFAGPLGKVALRQPGLRWARNVSPRTRLGLAFENPAGDLSGPSPALSSDSVPDTIAYIQRSGDWGHIKLAGLVRRLDARRASTWAGGINVTGRVSFDWLSERDNLAFQLQLGSGVTRYLAGFAGSGLDGTVSDEGQIDTADLISGFAAYQHWWSNRLRSTIAIGAMRLESAETADSLSFERGVYAGINLFWTPIDGANFGFDIIRASRYTLADRDGDGTRLLATARFDF
ncbi:MAG: DcaP family trimeric outer membrane transporter [Pseudomonadota bacterium]